MSRAAPFAVLLFALLVSCAYTPTRLYAHRKMQTKVVVRHSDGCDVFRPVYLEPNEVRALSHTTLGEIVINNDEGARRCGWKKLKGDTQSAAPARN